MRIVPDTPLAPLTTLNIGGPARVLATLETQGDFANLIARTHNTGESAPIVIGDGSNILVSDDGYDGTIAVMRVEGIKFQTAPSGEHVLATVQAGHSLQGFVDAAVEMDLSGVEMLSGIPGSTGATPIQNVGAYGQEVGECIATVHAYDWQQNRYVELSASECRFGHRTSVFKHTNRWTILSVTFALTPSRMSCPLTYRGVAETAGVAVGEPAPLAEAVAAVRDVRAKKGMLLDPTGTDRRTVGSVFMSPVITPSMARRLHAEGAPVNAFPDGSTRVSASWLIRMAGFSLGEQLTPGTRISTKHYTLVADGEASAEGFARAAELVATRVERVTGVRMRAEPDLIGHLHRYKQLTENAGT